jgi:hypothetical protein
LSPSLDVGQAVVEEEGEYIAGCDLLDSQAVARDRS